MFSSDEALLLHLITVLSVRTLFLINVLLYRVRQQSGPVENVRLVQVDRWMDQYKLYSQLLRISIQLNWSRVEFT